MSDGRWSRWTGRPDGAAFRGPAVVLACIATLSACGGVPFERDVIAGYDVAGGDVGHVLHGAPQPDVEEVWAEVSEAMPPFWRRRIAELAIAGDGPYGVAASVMPLDGDATRWRLTVDPVDRAQTRSRYVEILVHELAHVVTLSDGVLTDGGADTFSASQTACDGPGVPGACVVPGTWAHAFVEEFWTDADRATADRFAAGAGIDDAVAAHDAARFVTPYAMTDPLEDLAETFTALVLDRDPPGALATAKIEHLRATPELAALAVQVRLALVDR